jgi:hypothetical protein
MVGPHHSLLCQLTVQACHVITQSADLLPTPISKVLLDHRHQLFGMVKDLSTKAFRKTWIAAAGRNLLLLHATDQFLDAALKTECQCRTYGTDFTQAI